MRSQHGERTPWEATKRFSSPANSLSHNVNAGPNPTLQVLRTHCKQKVHAITHVCSLMMLHWSYSDPLQFECYRLRVEAPNVEVSKRQALQGQTLGRSIGTTPWTQPNTINQHQALSNQGATCLLQVKPWKFAALRTPPSISCIFLALITKASTIQVFQIPGRQSDTKYMLESIRIASSPDSIAKDMQYIYCTHTAYFPKNGKACVLHLHLST